MKAVVDDKIPYIRQAIESVADEVTYLPGREISRRDVADADVLIVRTRTRCDRDLLHGSRVQMIATATIGYDHIDTAWCEANGIEWTNCPGCNAASVAQYVQSALILLSRRHHRPLRGMTNPLGDPGLPDLLESAGREADRLRTRRAARRH